MSYTVDLWLVQVATTLEYNT